MRLLDTTITLQFWAEYPDDDAEADVQADRICDEIAAALQALPYVADGSVSVADFDTPA